MLKAMAEWQQPQMGQLVLKASDSVGNHQSSKRQRRPSVRLGEIGGLPAAFAAEPHIKRKKQFGASYESVGTIDYPIRKAGHADGAANSVGNGAAESNVSLAKAGRAAKTRPLIHVEIGTFHEHNSMNGVHYRQEHRTPPNPTSSHATLPFENPSPVRTTSLVGFGKKGRNRKRRHWGTRGLAPIEKLTRAIPSIVEIDDNENEKASDMDGDSTDSLSDDPYDAHTPEGFRDIDLETSEGFRDAKEEGNSGEADLPAMCMGLQGQEQVCESRQMTEENASVPEQEKNGKYRDGEEGNNNHLVGSVAPIPASVVSPYSETEVKPIHCVPTRLVPEANGNADDRELLSDNADEKSDPVQQVGKQCVALVNGVKGWLHGLGLGKYVQVFEAHEVDEEVLPLLTLDDLKEMGINTVGPRRKIFFAIQQLKKGFIA